MFKVNLVGLARNAASVINPKKDRGAYAFMLEELADHVGMVQRGESTIAEFASLYMLEPTS